jgi:hypothetical protein
MTGFLRLLFITGTFFLFNPLFGQDTSPIQWQVKSSKISDKEYLLHFQANSSGWQLYAPNQDLDGFKTAEIQFQDSAIQLISATKDSGSVKTIESTIFEGININIYDGVTEWQQHIKIVGDVPASLSGILLFTYGNDEEFYPSTTYNFNVELEGGVASAARILIPTIDLKNPVVPCGDDEAGDKGMMAIFFLGFIGGLIALITPCVFPLIPLTVSFFTKRSGT